MKERISSPAKRRNEATPFCLWNMMTRPCPLSRRQVCLAVSILFILGIYVSARVFHPAMSHLLFRPLDNSTVERAVHHAAALASTILSGSHPTPLLNASRISSPKANTSKASRIASPEAKNQPSAPHPKRYLFHGYQGRLGNVLFQFSAIYCIAALNNLTLVVNDRIPLQDLRDLPFPSLARTTPVKDHPAAMGCAFHTTLMALQPTNTSHALGGYFQSWRYFEPCKAEVKRAVRFKDNIINKAVSILTDLRRKLPGRTLVGVHVRMEDYLLPSEKGVGRKVAPPEYYHRALTYFRSRFRDVTFVVIASNPSWFRSKVSDSPDVSMLGRSASPAVDMEVLSRMDHLIFSVGTFGWWAGYKSNGTVVGYKDFYVPESVYGRKMSSSEDNYFYPGWIRL